MLTQEQREIRATGIGASEIAAVAGIGRWGSPIEVWLQKPTANRPAIIPEESDDIGPAHVGSFLEPSMGALYTAKTGLEIERPQRTIRHPEHSWVLASPDAIPIAQPERLVEFKVVGWNMVADWAEGVPDYVRCQALWQCFVTGANFVDVAVLRGTDFQILPVERDDEIIASLFEIGREFWFDRVLTDTPPPPSDSEDRKEYMAKRFRKYRDEMRVLDGEAVQAVTNLVAHYIDAKAAAARAKTLQEAAEATLMEIIGDKAGVECVHGRVTWKRPEFGGISYKGIAEELAPFGVIPPEVYARHTSTPSRRFNFYPPSKKRNGGR